MSRFRQFDSSLSSENYDSQTLEEDKVCCRENQNTSTAKYLLIWKVGEKIVVDDMFNFSNWEKWVNRDMLGNLEHPGVYAIAYSEENLSGKKFSWLEEIIYIGMTNSQGGLKNRLRQFDNTINGKEGHGGAKRVRKKYNDYDSLIKKLYVSIKYFKCDVRSNQAMDLIVMGEVAKFEYVCFAEYVKKFGRLPEFNDKKRSPK